MAKAHPGFKAVQGKIEKEGYSKKAAGAILASKTRKASASAKAKNPRLKKVKGKMKKFAKTLGGVKASATKTAKGANPAKDMMEKAANIGAAKNVKESTSGFGY